MGEEAIGCARPTGGPVGETQEEVKNTNKQETKKERSMLMVGQKVPDFTAPGYQNGKNLSMLNCLTIWGNGFFSVSTLAISPLSEQLKFQRSLKNILSYKNLV